MFAMFATKSPAQEEQQGEEKKKNTITFAEDVVLESQHAPTSYLETLAHLFKANVGTGCFGMADAIRNAGILLGPAATVVIAVIAIECMRMLLEAADYIMKQNRMSTRPDYADVVELSFSTSRHERWRKCSKFMRSICNFSICITQLGFCCVYLLFVSKSIKLIADYYGHVIDLKLLMTIVLIPTLLSALVRQLKKIAIISGIANVCMLIGAALTLSFCVDLPPLKDHNYVRLDTLPLYFGTALFAFEGIAVILPLQNSMKKPELFPKFPFGVLYVGMILVSMIYIGLGTMGYWKFGEATQGSLTLNLPTDQILAQVVILMVACGVMLGYAIQFFVAIQILLPSVYRKFKSAENHPVLTELLFRTFMVLVTFAVAQVVPNLSLLLSLIGSVCCTVLAFIFPSIIALMTTSNKSGGIGVVCWIKNFIILSIATCGFVLGGGLSLKGIYDEFIATHL